MEKPSPVHAASFTIHLCALLHTFTYLAMNYSGTSLFWTPLGQFGTGPSVLIRELSLFQR